jgi:hypothetical protein
MAINLGEILALIAKAEALGELIAQAWADMKERAAQEADEKKRRKLIEAITSRDLDAIRAVLFSVDN